MFEIETRNTEYFLLCRDYIRGKFGQDIPDSLNATTQEMLTEFTPETLIKLQVKALQEVLSSHAEDAECFERFAALTESNHIQYKRFLLEDLYFIINTLADITEDLDNKVAQLRPCQMQLFKLQQISHAIVKNANFGVLAVDESDTITMFNEAASEILYVPNQVIGKQFQDGFSVMPQETVSFLTNCLTITGSFRKEINVKGKIKVVLVETKVLLKKNGQREGAVLMLFDITAREQENKLLEENIKLAAVGKLAAGVAHEVKNPLTVIKGFSQLLLTREYEPDQRTKYLQLICKEVDRANDFILDFLKLGKPKKPHRKIIDPLSVIEDVILLIQSQCYLNGVTITKRLDCSKKILADPDQLKQVLINLAKNSLEAMEDPKLAAKNITFQTSIDDKSQTLAINVSDTGPGICEDILDKISSSFFTTKKFGTGLGLNISKSIIEQHGGQLTIASGPKGTTATIKLPLLSELKIHPIYSNSETKPLEKDRSFCRRIEYN